MMATGGRVGGGGRVPIISVQISRCYLLTVDIQKLSVYFVSLWGFLLKENQSSVRCPQSGHLTDRSLLIL